MTGMVRYREQKTLVEVLVILFWQLTEMTHYGNIHEEITKDRVEVSFTWTTLKHFGTGPILCH